MQCHVHNKVHMHTGEGFWSRERTCARLVGTVRFFSSMMKADRGVFISRGRTASVASQCSRQHQQHVVWSMAVLTANSRDAHTDGGRV